MKKKLMILLVGSILSVLMLAGCNNNDRNNLLPVNNDGTNRDNILDRNKNINNYNDNNNNLNRNRNMNNDLDRNRNMNNNNDLLTPTRDINTDTDKDLIRDRNTRQEDLFEDDLDRNDRDNIDR